jgi:L-lactate dehydrogenase complex protein LldG
VGGATRGETLSTLSSGRQLILDRIRGAAAGSSPEAGPDPYIRKGGLDAESRLELMAERLREYDADVLVCRETDLLGSIKDRLVASGRRTFLAPPGLPAGWCTPAVGWTIDHDLNASEIEGHDGVLTSCFAGVADSGTIVLHHSASEGRRVLTLLPDWHLCILRASQIVETLPEYFDRCAQPPRLATYISGPSATADIEMTRIKGVHGPRFLNVLLVRDQ